MFTNPRREALETSWSRLETKGFVREDADLASTTTWDNKNSPRVGTIDMAGRFAQWKYFWTDDCALRAAAMSQAL
jgi:hypothetical protein